DRLGKPTVLQPRRFNSFARASRALPLPPLKLRLLALKRRHDHVRYRSNARSAIEVAMHDKPHVIPLRALGPYPHKRGKSSRKVGGDLTNPQSRRNSLSE